MPYAVLQTELGKPTIEQMGRAFRSVPGLTPMDAHILGNDAFGVLVKNFSEPQSIALQGALRIEGVETEIVDQSLLPVLPAKHIVHRLDCAPEHLMIYDPAGRGFALEWRHVMFIAAGAVRMTEFVRERQRREKISYTGNGLPIRDVDYDLVSREEQNFHLLAEIFVANGTLRYTVQADKFNFSYLGPRKANDPITNFALLVRDLAQFATGAALNQGAEAIRSGDSLGFTYPSQNAFYEETVWSLWQLKKLT
jgi:hypothetical protein